MHEPNLKIQQVLESESNKESERDKFNRVDVLVKTEQGKYIIVEVQCYTQWDFLTRILYGTSKVICEYLNEGDDYKNVAKVVSVNIVFFDLGVGKDYLYKGTTVFKGLHYHDILGLNEKEQKIYQPIHHTKNETPSDIFPEYYIIKISQFHEKVQDKIDEWIYFLKNGAIKEGSSAKGLASASKKLDILKLNEEGRRAYKRYQTALRDDASFNSTFAVEKEVAFEEGIKQGIEKGMEQSALLKAEKIALRLMHQGNMPLAEISEMTGISVEDLLILQTTLKNET